MLQLIRYDYNKNAKCLGCLSQKKPKVILSKSDLITLVKMGMKGSISKIAKKMMIRLDIEDQL